MPRKLERSRYRIHLPIYASASRASNSHHLISFHIVYDIQTRAGSHDNVPRREIDHSAFSFSKNFPKSDPVGYVKGRSGNGGTMVSILILVCCMLYG
jgi:hypothetical protein